VKVIIRADASIEIGSGHVMRCLTVAKKFRKAGCQVTFWMEPLPGNIINFVAQEGFDNLKQADYADLYIIDHYSLDKEWEQAIRKYAQQIFVIDDLARSHECDVVLDQNIVPNYATRYDGLVPKHCIKLLGPQYLIVRDEFIKVRQQPRERRDIVKRLLVFMGGSDPTNETMKVLQALDYFIFEHVDIVVGNGNPSKVQIESICNKRGYHFHCQIDYIAILMQQADFAIGTGGATMWERCYVGLPSSATIVAENQRETTEYAEKLSVVNNLGWHEQVTEDTYKNLLSNLTVNEMGAKGLALTANKQPNAWMYKIMELMK